MRNYINDKFLCDVLAEMWLYLKKEGSVEITQARRVAW